MNLHRLKYDFKLLKGDPMLMLSMAVPFILWALMQFLIPWVIEMVIVQWDFDLSPYYRQAGTFFLMLIPMMMGMVYGFILLDERDGGIITAISVTPTGKTGYLKLRLGIPMILSFVAILLFQILLDQVHFLLSIQKRIDHHIDIIDTRIGVAKGIFNRLKRESVLLLIARKAFFPGGKQDLPVFND